MGSKHSAQPAQLTMPLYVTVRWSMSLALHGVAIAATVTSKGPDFAYNLRIDDPLPPGTTLSATLPGTVPAPRPQWAAQAAFTVCYSS